MGFLLPQTQWVILLMSPYFYINVFSDGSPLTRRIPSGHRSRGNLEQLVLEGRAGHKHRMNHPGGWWADRMISEFTG